MMAKRARKMEKGVMKVPEGLVILGDGSGYSAPQVQEGQMLQPEVTEPMAMDEEEYWEEVIDKDDEDKMVADIEAGAEEEFGIESEDMIGGWAWDDVRDKQLDVEKVREARSEEVGYMIGKGIWKVVDIMECWEKTGKAPVTVKWVDTDKGDGKEAKIRSRLVARDFPGKGEKDREDLFAATPPLELLRMVISKTATITMKSGRRKMLFIDV